MRVLGAEFYSRRGQEGAGAGLKVWSRERPIPLSERVPVLENMGFRVVDEHTYRITPGPNGEAGTEVWLHDMLLEPAEAAQGDFDLEALKQRLMPEDVARVAPFPIPEEWGGMTGQCSVVDGGWL